MEKQSYDSFRKGALNLLSEIKALDTLLKTVVKSVQDINNQIKQLYSNGNSIIQDEVQEFLERTEGFSLRSLPIIENEVNCSEWYFKDIGKSLNRYNLNEIKSINEQRYDTIDLTIMLYIKNVVNLTGEKATSYKKLLYNAIQDGITIPKSLTILSTFQTLIDSRIGCMYLKKFLNDKKLVNAVDFYRSVYLYKTNTTQTIREWVCTEIYEQYITEGASNEITLSTKVRERINKQYAIEPTTDMFDDAQKEVFERMSEDGIFEKFLNSSYLPQLAIRLHQIPSSKEMKTTKNCHLHSTQHIHEQECEVYVRVAKYLSEYNLVQFTEQFVNYGFTSPQLMAMMSDRDIQLLNPCEADAKRLTEFVKISKAGQLISSKTLTKEAITKVKTIQQDFFTIFNTLDFLKYIESQPIQQLNVAQIIAKAEMSFQELHSKHHIALRILRKSDSIQEVEPLLPQCQSALVALLVDDHVEEYNDAESWKPTPRKLYNQSPNNENEENISLTPQITISQSNSTPALELEDFSDVDSPPSENELKSDTTIKTFVSVRQKSESELRNSIHSQLDEENCVESEENRVTTIIKTFKEELIPQLSNIKTKLSGVKSEDDLELCSNELSTLADMKKLFIKETIKENKPKTSIFLTKASDVTVAKQVTLALQDVGIIEEGIIGTIEKLNVLKTSIRTTNTIIHRYHNMARQFVSMA
ncbi:RGS domain-containing protein [Entamoeba marina]